MQIFINSGCPIAEVKHRIPVGRGQFHTHRRAIIHQALVSERRLADEKTQVPAFTQSLHSVHPRSRNNCHSAAVSHAGVCLSQRQLQEDPEWTWTRPCPVGGCCRCLCRAGRVLCARCPAPPAATQPWAPVLLLGRARGTQAVVWRGMVAPQMGYLPISLTVGPVLPFPRLM